MSDLARPSLRCSRTATSRLSAEARGLPARRQGVVARGILDSYRRSQGLPVPEGDGAAAGPSTSGSGAEPAVAVQQRERPRSRQQQMHLEELLDLDGGDIESGEWHATEDDTPCPVECVIDLMEAQELHGMLDAAPADTLVVVDYYKTSCGACKYIANHFVKLCKATQTDNPAVLFARHNVYNDEEEEVTDLARELEIRNVPLFCFYLGGKEVERFATRDKARLAEAIACHSVLTAAEVEDTLLE